MSFSSSFQGATDHPQNPVQIHLNFSLASLPLVQTKQLIYFILFYCCLLCIISVLVLLLPSASPQQQLKEQLQ